jgi:streptogramin lyase
MRRTVCLFLLVLVALASGASAQFTVLHSFSGPDGGSPTGLIQTANGTFYGAAALGGDTCRRVSSRAWMANFTVQR